MASAIDRIIAILEDAFWLRKLERKPELQFRVESRIMIEDIERRYQDQMTQLIKDKQDFINWLKINKLYSQYRADQLQLARITRQDAKQAQKPGFDILEQ